MRTSTIITSSLLAIAVSGAPIDLPKLPVNLPDLSLPSLPVKRADLPLVGDIVEDLNLPALPAPPQLPTDNLKLPVKRAELPVVGDVLEGLKLPSIPAVPALPSLPVGNLDLPVRRADLPIVGDIIDDIPLLNGVDPNLHLPLPINSGLVKKAVDVGVSVPVNANVDVVDVNVPAVGVPPVPAVGVPAVPAVGVPLVPAVGAPFIDELHQDLGPREIKQSLPVVGGVDVPLDAGKIQVGTVDKYVEEVAKDTTVEQLPVEEVVQGATIKDLPNVVPRQDKQTLPLVGGIDVPLDLGKAQLGAVGEYVEDVVKGVTSG